MIVTVRPSLCQMVLVSMAGAERCLYIAKYRPIAAVVYTP